MAEHENGATGPQAAAAQPRMQILNQFIRDLSFENIAVQKGVLPEGKPEVKVTINLDAASRGTDLYDVALKLKVDSRVESGALVAISAFTFSASPDPRSTEKSERPRSSSASTKKCW